MYIYSLALVIRFPERMPHIIFSSVACLTQPPFSTLPHKQYDIRKIFTEHKMFVLISTELHLKHFASKKNSVRYYLKYT